MAIPAFQKPDKWTSRPLDPKCKTLTDYDPTVEDQIRCKVPAWSGDFRELVPELIAQGVRFDELARLTVHDIGQFVIRAVQGGSLRCGSVGTAKHTIVRLPPSVAPAAVADGYVGADDNLSDTHWKILEACVEWQLIDRASAKPTKDITSLVMAVGDKPFRHSLVDLRRYYEVLKNRGLIDGAAGAGTWITSRGIALVESRHRGGRYLPRVVS
jgi:hypothetical protein